MTRLTATARLLARDAFLVLATLAIALKIMIPAGYMPGMEPRNGLPFALVLCTGDGARMVEPGQSLAGHKGDSQDKKAAHDGGCPFASQGAAAPPPTVTATDAVQLVAYLAPPTPLERAVAPGRGLAAPPPPPTGPPALLI
ncbi:DUF2946 family protein [Caulobacter sp.]|uniref:DUF2946 family protein n=1 Tax=Caulobacter sp. TaxID=78 RepID=UPI0025C5ED2F|nr:DUF2946 family protein [Caulobacter sp.]MBQ1562956.1 hypothetical protein [Caulobacter sp.]